MINMSEKYFCPECGASLELGIKFCSNCGKSIQPTAQPTAQPTTQPAAQPQVQSSSQAVNVNVVMPQQQVVIGELPPSPLSRGVALLLCIFLGYLGVHKFYIGNIGMGVIYLLTFGFFGIGPFVDFFVILLGGSRDVKGRLLVNW